MTQQAAPRRRRARDGFTLVELLAVIGIIAILIALLVPTIKRARDQAKATQCASNLHQIAIAFNSYLIESRNSVFWRGPNIGIDGMDWCTWGGRERGNQFVGQKGLFNRIIPRPLNRHASNDIELFHCPSDESVYVLDDDFSRFEDVGNSYNFNADGYPKPSTGVQPPGRGLGGIKITDVKDSSRTILFYDAGLLYDTHWHPRYRGNICLVDGHVAFSRFPTDQPGEEFVWH